ncbi:hypothetical protein L3Y34_005466 [Caenorhabditis briggsae]|uniref:F-box domain-containing protein n=1 Tax=Caenorhabditis briggsae TaxID=6238 RepID=A0AAE9D6X7_CAEBR|nr:hypothetical protein L3Y34_005466 [Caenorhabditis briggsae]
MSNRFNVPHLPSVIMRHLFEIIGPSEIFLLCLFLPKFRQIAQTVKWFDNKYILVDYCSYGKEAVLYMKYGPNDEKIPILRWTFQNRECHFLKKRKIDGRKFRCCLDFTTGPTPMIYFARKDNDFFWGKIRQLFFQLFRPESIQYLHFSMDTLPRIPKNHTNFNRIEIWESKSGQCLKAADFERFFEKKHDKNCLNRIQTVYIKSYVDGEFAENSGIFDIIELIIARSQSLKMSQILNFSGRFAIFMSSKLDGFEFLEICQKWQKGGFPNLEALSIMGSSYVSLDALLYLKTGVWENRPKCYKPRSAYFFLDKNNYDVSNAVDLYCESTGLWASVIFTDKQFHLFVWKG